MTPYEYEGLVSDLLTIAEQAMTEANLRLTETLADIQFGPEVMTDAYNYGGTQYLRHQAWEMYRKNEIEMTTQEWEEVEGLRMIWDALSDVFRKQSDQVLDAKRRAYARFA